MIEELELNARFDMLVAQRNNALNQNVLDAGIIATLQAKVKSLEAMIPAPTEEYKVNAQESEDA